MNARVLIISLGLICTVTVQAQQPTADSLALQEVELVGSRITSTDVFYMSHQDRRLRMDAPNELYLSLQEAMESFSGIDLQQRGPFDVQSDVSIRGGTFNQTGIFIDGVPYNDPQTGHHQLNLPLALRDVAQVEVLSGQTRTLGGQAFAGALNFQLHRDTGTFANLQLYGGRYGLAGLQGRASTQLGRQQWGVSIHSSRSDGYRTNTDFFQNQARISGEVPLRSGRIQTFLGYSQKAFGAQSFYSNNYPNQFEAIHGLMGHVKASWFGAGWVHKGFVSFRHHRDRFELFREGAGYYSYDPGMEQYVSANDTAPDWYAGPNFHRSATYSAQYSAEHFWSHRQRTVVALNFRSEGVLSNVLGDSLGESVQVMGGGEIRYPRGTQRINQTVAIDHHLLWRHLMVTAGVLYQMNSDFLPEWMPGLEAAYFLQPNIKLVYAINRTYRLPTFTELYYNVGGAQGSEFLLPEKAWVHDLSMEWRKPNFQMQISLHQRRTDRAIDWLEWADGQIEASNLSEVQFIGADWRANWAPMVQWIQSIQASYSYLNGQHEFQDQSVYALRYLRHQAHLGITHPLGDDWTLSWATRMQQRVHIQAPWDRAVVLCAAQISYRPTGALHLQLAVDNLLNTPFADRNGIEQPGIWPWLRIAKTF